MSHLAFGFAAKINKKENEGWVFLHPKEPRCKNNSCKPIIALAPGNYTVWHALWLFLVNKLIPEGIFHMNNCADENHNQPLFNNQNSPLRLLRKHAKRRHVITL